MNQRITTEMVSASTLNNINSALQSLQRSSNELSSGKRILEPSDDPYGTSHVIDLGSQIEGLGSYGKAVSDGLAWNQAAEGAMGNVNEILQHVRELLIEASNGTNNAGDLENIGGEITQLTEAIKQDANTQYAGQYVFSGTDTTTAPYQAGGGGDEFQGNAEAVLRSIGPGATVQISTNLSAVLGNGQGAEDGKLLDVLRTISQHLNEATPESRAALSTTDLKALEGGMEALVQVQAVSGSTTNQLHTASTRIEALEDSLNKALSDTANANIAQVSIEYSNEQAAYEAALRAGANIIQESLLNFLRE
jgi:flagellar hook-associated protein 3 FlgL